MAEHDLKCWPEQFEPLASGAKPFEVRRDDRGFQVGDTLRIREWDHVAGYSGSEVRRHVTHILRGGQFGVAEGYVVLGLASSSLMTTRAPEISAWLSQDVALGFLGVRPDVAAALQATNRVRIDDAADPHGSCSSCCEEHPVGVLDDGLCPACVDDPFWWETAGGDGSEAQK